MASSSIFHLLTNPPVASFPDSQTIISATTPATGRLTTMLLDPATPPIGATQYLANSQSSTGGTINVVIGRWITRQLPAQTIGAGNWTFYGAARGTAGTNGATNLWGFTVAQWRAGTGVVATFLDAPTGGSSATLGSGGVPYDAAGATTVAGGALTLLLNDQIILEVWSRGSYGGPFSLLLNGQDEYYPGTTAASPAMSSTDAYLKAPAAITYL